MIGLRKASGLVEQAAVFLRKASGLVEQEVYLRTSDGLKLIHSPGSDLAVDVTPDVFGAGASAGAVSVTTNVATATPSGGDAPYTYDWTTTDEVGASWTILSPTAASTQFRTSPLAAYDNATATFACTVTDSRGHTATGSVAATATNYGKL